MTPETLAYWTGWAACALIVTGILLIGYKRRAGFLVIAVGGMLTGAVMFLQGNDGLLVQNVFAVGANLYSWRRWKRLKQKETDNAKRD